MWVMTYPNLFTTKRVTTAGGDATTNALRNYILAWISIVVLVIISGVWIWLATEMFKTMPHTFAWEMLLRSFGSSFSLDCPEGFTSEDAWPSTVNCTPISHSIPCVPIIALMVLFVTIACAFVSLLPLSLSTLDAAAYGVRVALTWHLLFLVVCLICVIYFFNEDSGSLRPVMLAALEASKIEVTEMWNLTQIHGECCGIDSYKDWNFVDGKYPISCICPNTTYACNVENVWEQGCLRREEITIEIYGTINFFLLCFECFVNIFLCYLIEGLRSAWFSSASVDRERRDFELEAPLLK